MTTERTAGKLTAPSERVPAGAASLADHLPGGNAELAEPYRGINPFRLADAELFFARAEETLRLTRSLMVYRGVLVYGESGVGKSSLINAGLIPAAIEMGYHPERLRVRPVKGGELLVERISSDDTGRKFLPSLLRELSGRAEVGGPEMTLSPEELLELLAPLSHKLPADATQHVQARRAGIRPLLIFDQFEESVTLFDEAAGPEAALARADMQRRIFECITKLLNNYDLPVKIILSFREDYFAKLSKLFQLVPELTDRFVRVVSPDADDLLTIVRQPLTRFIEKKAASDEVTATRARTLLELAPRLEALFMSRVGHGDIVLTEVQIACTALWRSNNPEQLLAEGLQSILEKFLVATLKEYRSADKDAAVALLSRMVTKAGTRSLIAETELLDQVEKESGVARARLLEILADFDGRKTWLVRREEPRGIPYFTIASEFLIPKIQRWRNEREAERRRTLLLRRLAAWTTPAVMAAGFLAFNYQRKVDDRVEELQKDSVILANVASDPSLDSTRLRLLALQDSTTAAVRRADSVAGTVSARDTTISGLQARLLAEIDARTQLDAALTRALGDADSLRLAAARSRALADARLREIYGLHNERAGQQIRQNVQLNVRLRALYVIEDGEGGNGWWTFTVASGGQTLIQVPRSEYNNDNRQPKVFNAELRRGASGREGETLPLLVRGVHDSERGHVIEGSVAIVIRSAGEYALRPETVHVLLYDRDDPNQGAFVAILEISA